MKKKEVSYHARKFLNKSQGLAAIEIFGNANGYGLDGTVSIRDCSRQITLDFNCWDKRRMNNSIAKMDELINELTKFRNWFVDVGIPTYQEQSKLITKKKDDSFDDLVNRVIELES